MDHIKNIPIEQIKGISKVMIEKLHQNNISNVYDLLMYFPYRYENYEVANIHAALDLEKVTVVGVVVTEPVFSYIRRNLTRVSFALSVDNLVLKIVAFNREFLRGKLSKGMAITVTGKLEKSKAQIVANTIKLKEQEDDRIEPVYSLKDLHKTYFLNVVKKAYEQYKTYINDDLPLALMNQYRLIGSQDLISFAHFPLNNEQVKQVSRRYKYEELLKFELKMMVLKDREKMSFQKSKKVFDEAKIGAFIHSLSLELTVDQVKVKNEILNDMKSEYPMNRLLQGDVGSGKTVVAAISLYANYLSLYQGCLMAPTEILAEQNYSYLKEIFRPYGIKVELLTSSTSKKTRSQIFEDLKNGTINILVGTHALISDGVDYKSLGLIIVDEQHRFGVNQRKILRDKGELPDSLFLSATPIPRTLALTSFGDMDVSSIKVMPKGRKKIETYLIKSKLEQRLIKFIDERLTLNEQVYIITPLIEESEKMDLENAIHVYEKYKNIYDGKYKVGLLHGKLSNQDKEQVMSDFKENKIQILVSTTVVEVGVNVVNATLMIIIDAHRFGLSQLHQLRGRVGRSHLQSYCILVSDYQNDKTKERLEIMTKTNDGFEIAEADLKLRGPGDFFGSRQSGLPEFKMADLINDYKILEIARDDAELIVKSRELFTNPDYFALRIFVEQELMNNNEIFD